MRNLVCLLCGLVVLTACNSVYMKPSTLDTDEVFYVDAGGSLMQQGVKEIMEKRGYNLTVGHISLYLRQNLTCQRIQLREAHILCLFKTC